MSIPPTWNKTDLNANIHGDTWVSHQHNNKGISNKKHDESWQQVHPIDDSASHQAGIMKQVRKRDPTSNMDRCSTMHSKKNYMNTLHIPHILGPSEEKDFKLLKLVVPSISWCWISWKWLFTHECWHLHSTLKSGWKMKWENGKSECTIRFVASNKVKSTVKFLNSEKVEIWGLRNLLDSPRFLKDSLFLLIWRSVAQIRKLIAPSGSCRWEV